MEEIYKTRKTPAIYNPKSYTILRERFEARNIFFPNEHFGAWVNLLEKKTKGRYKLLNSEIVPEKINTFEEYIVSLLKTTYNGSTPFNPTIISSICEVASFWCKYTIDLESNELALIMVSQFVRIHCTVLYSSDIAPNNPDVKIFSTTISSGRGCSGKPMYRK